MDMQTSSKLAAEDLAEPLQDLPPVQFAFAYGSAVFQQHSGSRQDRDKKENDVPQTDYILGVAHPADWHAENLEQNRGHYAALLARCGGPTVAAVADYIGVGVHFNTLVPWHDKVIKYGVVSSERLVRDILAWDSLYVSGRLQKPVLVLVDELGVNRVNQVNLQSAIAAALLQLPGSFTSEDLLCEICSLSYRGDIRMLFAEDPQKVSAIVQGSFQQLMQLYAAPAQVLAGLGHLDDSLAEGGGPTARWHQDTSPATRESLIGGLPWGVITRIAPRVGLRSRVDHSEAASELARALVTRGEGQYQAILRRSMASIVRASSFRQALSGFLAAGGSNAARYVRRKMRKAWLAR